MYNFFDGIAEGRKEICTLCRVTSWRTIQHRVAKKQGFKSLIHRNPANGKPYIVVEEYKNYQSGFNKL